MTKVRLSGVIPEPPVILCRDDDAQLLVMHNLHEDYARTPPTMILEEWPDLWKGVNAVVVTPIRILGAEKATSFSIVGDAELTENEREVLDAYIKLMRSGMVGKARYRDIATATNMNRRTIGAALKSLSEKGIGVYRYREGYTLDIFKLVMDAEKAKAIGINIREY